MPAKLMVQILGEATSAVSAFKKTGQAAGDAEGAAKKTGGAWAGVGKVAAAVGGAFAAAKVVEFAKDSIGAASDLNESWSKVGVVFGTSAGAVQKWSQSSATSMGLSQQAALEAAGTYGNLARALGLAPPVAAKMSTSLVSLAGDLASFNNVPVGDAIEALRSGLTGEVEPLRRFGVSLSQTRVEAEALRLGLVKAPVDMGKVTQATGRLELAQRNATEAVKKYGANSKQAQSATLNVQSAQAGLTKAMAGGKVNLDAAAKAQATYSLIMKDTATAQGDFARTSGGLANQQRIAAAEMENMKATVGTALLPVVVQLAKVFTSDLMPAVRVVADLFARFAPILLPVGAAILVVVGAVKAWNVVQLVLNSQLWAMAAALLANPITWIVLAIVGLITVIVLLATKTQFFQTIWRALTSFMVAAWRATVGAITSAWNAAFAFISRVFGMIQGAAMAVWGWIRGNWPLLLGILTGPFGLAIVMIIRYWSQITGFFGGIVSGIAGVFSRVISAITSPFVTAFNIVRGIVDAALGGIRSAVSSVLGFVNSGINTAKGVYNAFARGWNAIQVSMPSVDTHIPGVGKVGGFTVGLPDLPMLARGGLITSSGIVFAHAGEVISPAPRGAAGGQIVNVRMTVNVPATANPAETGRAVATALRSFFAAGGRLEVPA